MVRMLGFSLLFDLRDSGQAKTAAVVLQLYATVIRNRVRPDKPLVGELPTPSLGRDPAMGFRNAHPAAIDSSTLRPQVPRRPGFDSVLRSVNN
jgi:hypothetical protein